MLEKYLNLFAKLRTDRGRDRYPEITYHRAPHKPFLLLSVMDLIDKLEKGTRGDGRTMKLRLAGLFEQAGEILANGI